MNDGTPRLRLVASDGYLADPGDRRAILRRGFGPGLAERWPNWATLMLAGALAALGWYAFLTLVLVVAP